MNEAWKLDHENLPPIDCEEGLNTEPTDTQLEDDLAASVPSIAAHYQGSVTGAQFLDLMRETEKDQEENIRELEAQIEDVRQTAAQEIAVLQDRLNDHRGILKGVRDAQEGYSKHKADGGEIEHGS